MMTSLKVPTFENYEWLKSVRWAPPKKIFRQGDVGKGVGPIRQSAAIVDAVRQAPIGSVPAVEIDLEDLVSASDQTLSQLAEKGAHQALQQHHVALSSDGIAGPRLGGSGVAMFIAASGHVMSERLISHADPPNAQACPMSTLTDSSRCTSR